VNGLLIEPNDTQALATAITGLIAEKDQRDHLGTAATETAKAKFNAAHSAERVMKFYALLWQS
jgi:glycosyltransferase involved in cell wall biosynthesis